MASFCNWRGPRDPIGSLRPTAYTETQRARESYQSPYKIMESKGRIAHTCHRQFINLSSLPSVCFLHVLPGQVSFTSPAKTILKMGPEGRAPEACIVRGRELLWAFLAGWP